jgi:oligopeptide transport system substrate-binding protein
MSRILTLRGGGLALGLFVLAAIIIAVLAAGGAGNSASGTKAAKSSQVNLAATQVITVNWGTEPPSLDPGLATDTTSANILLNIMDPLVKLGPSPALKPVPSLAQSWTISKDGKTYTFHLRHDGRWTNGQRVTAHDFVFSWLRTISPALAADYAYQFYGIVGAQAYNGCKSNCGPLRSKVGISAPNDYTLVVKLVSPQPWFLQQLAHPSFLAVNKSNTVKYGKKWTEAANIVTDGPFKLAVWKHDQEIDLVKNPAWRNASSVHLTRVNGKMITDGNTGLQAFKTGALDVDLTLPTAQIPQLKKTPEYQLYPALGTYYYGFNVKNIPDVHQRRAMALAVNQEEIIKNIAQADQLPATGFTPKGIAGFPTLNPNSPYLAANGNMAKAKAEMAKAVNPKKDINLYINDSPGHKEIAVAIQSYWQQLGIKSTIKVQQFAQYLQFLGPPPNSDVDVYRLGWIADYPDAYNFLSLWTCKSGNNNTNYCDPAYDALANKAIKTANTQARYNVYKQMEAKLFGPQGAVPLIPIYFYTFTSLEKTWIKGSFSINPMNDTDLTKVVVLTH